jgi:hypothetical protein
MSEHCNGLYSLLTVTRVIYISIIYLMIMPSIPIYLRASPRVFLKLTL